LALIEAKIVGGNKEYKQRRKKMSQVIDLCEDSDSDSDNGEYPNTASVPSLPISR
jgi:hypothetical protein